MKKIWVLLLFTGIGGLLFGQGENKPAFPAGSWAGPLKFQGTELRLVLNFSYNEADSLLVTLDSPDQGAKNISASKVVFRNDSLLVSIKSIGGKFHALVSPDHSTLDGTWNQGGMKFPLKLARLEKPLTVNRPQEPKPPFPYSVIDVTFPNTDAGIHLAGTLTTPDNHGIFPVMILISGSGPQNRDEELMGHKPFAVMADYFTQQGLAVLRFDDRGTGKSGGKFEGSTTFDFATDVEAAVDFLKTQPGIDTNRIGLLGHSEGGMIAPVVASARSEIAFMVLMAAPGVTGEKILITQAEAIAKAQGADEKTLKASLALNKDLYTVIRKNSDNEKAAAKIRSLIKSTNRKFAGDTAYQPLTDGEIDLQVSQLTGPWFRTFLAFNPENYLSKVSCPVLAINGSLDLQVDAKENLAAIEKALIFGGNSRYAVEELPGLNHLFQTATTGSPTEYSQIEETIAPSVLEIIGRWIWEQ